MITHVEAIRFDGIETSGRNNPLRVTAEDECGNEYDLYLKFSGQELGINGLARELLHACVGSHIGLPVCEPMIVNMSQEWIESVPYPDLQAQLSRSVSTAFGSKSAGDSWRLWTGNDNVLGDRRQEAVGIFAFDAFTGNPDRRDEKPNLLVKNNGFRVIDHEFCSMTFGALPPLRPWQVGNLSYVMTPGNHIFASLLKGDRYVDLAALIPAWQNLDDDSLFVYEAEIPDQWAGANGANGAVQQALTHLRAIRDSIEQCVEEIERILK